MADGFTKKIGLKTIFPTKKTTPKIIKYFSQRTTVEQRILEWKKENRIQTLAMAEQRLMWLKAAELSCKTTAMRMVVRVATGMDFPRSSK